MDTLQIWLVFILAATVVVYAAMKLSFYADIIGKRTNLSGLWVGSILLATATSLPELVASISSALLNLPDIAAGNVFGSNIYNIFNVAVIDFFEGSGSILMKVSPGHIFSLVIGMILSGFVAAAILIGVDYSIFHVGLTSLLLLLIYALGLKLMTSQGVGQEEEASETEISDVSLRRAITMFSLSAGAIVVAGTLMSMSGGRIAEVTGISGTFIGSILIAISTSLPETMAGIGAIRVKAYDMALGNFLGSNIFNMLIIFVADLAYLGGPILTSISQTHAITALFGLILASVLILGLVSKEQKTYFRLSSISWAIVILYLIVVYVLFTLR